MSFIFLTAALALLTPVISDPGWQYVGCIDETALLSTFSHITFDHDITPVDCTIACEAEHYAYAGLFEGSCYCGTSLSEPSIPLAEELCSLPCVPDSEKFCGGSTGVDGSPVALYEFAGSFRSTSVPSLAEANTVPTIEPTIEPTANPTVEPDAEPTTVLPAQAFIVETSTSQEFFGNGATQIQTVLDSTGSALLALLLPKPTAVVGMINSIPLLSGVSHDAAVAAAAAGQGQKPAAGLNASTVANLASAASAVPVPVGSAGLNSFATLALPVSGSGADGGVALATGFPAPKFIQFPGAAGRSGMEMIMGCWVGLSIVIGLFLVV